MQPSEGPRAHSRFYPVTSLFLPPQRLSNLYPAGWATRALRILRPGFSSYGRNRYRTALPSFIAVNLLFDTDEPIRVIE